MAWLEFTIETTPQSIDSAVTALSARGFSDLVIEDQSEFETFLEENRAYWDYIDEWLQKKLEGLSRIKLYLEDTDDNGRKRLDAAVKELGLTMTAAPLPETNWEESWKDNYPPQEIGDHIVVLPYWLAEESTDRLKVILDPGLTFGTGSHATTRLCLQALDTHIHGGERVLDLGCGSGILSIAALRLGAESAFACDIDEKCVDVAYENAALNGIGKDRYTVRWGDVLTDAALRQEMGAGYDIVVANIVADVIMGLSPHVRPFLKPDGLFLCSGIIDDRAAEVLEKLKADGWDVFEQRSSEGWFSYLCK